MSDATGESAESLQREKINSNPSSVTVKNSRAEVPPSTKWKELSWDSVSESYPDSNDPSRNTSTKERSSYRAGPHASDSKEPSTNDSSDLQMFADEDEEDEFHDTNVLNSTPPALGKELSKRNSGKKNPNLQACTMKMITTDFTVFVANRNGAS
jgi:hypothetical protein